MAVHTRIAGLAITAIVLCAALALPAQAVLTYSLEPVSGWDNDQARYDAAVAAIQNVTDRYNAFSPTGFGNYSVYVYYDSGIPTAQASYGGSIGFGGTYPADRVMQHEMAHYVGLPSGNWNSLISGGWSGPKGAALIQQFEGDGAVISGDSAHFWPYGLNYDDEWSELNAQRQVALVYAMRADLGIGPTAYPSTATNVSLTASDPVGTSGFNYMDRWSDGYFAHAGADYYTSDYVLRTPASANSFTFVGDSLSVNNTNGASGGLLYKGTGTQGEVTINDLNLNGGYIRHASGSGDLFQLGGNIILTGNPTIDAAQGSVKVLSSINGTGTLNLTGSNTVTLASPANLYTGPTNVASGTTLIVNGATGFGTTTVASGATLGGSGTVRGNLTSQAGTIQVGGTKIPSIVNGLIDNFDSYNNSGGTSLGATPNNLTGDVWVGVFDGTGAAHVSDKSGSDQAAKIYGVDNGWRGMETDLASNYAADFSLADGETATYFFQFNPTSSVEGAGSGFDTMMGLSDGVGNIDQTDAWQDFAVMPFFVGAADGTADLKATGPSGDVELISNATLNTWYNVWLVVDNDAKTYDVYTSTGTSSGVLRLANAPYRNGLGSGSLGAFGFMQGTNKGNSILFDNLYIDRDGVNTTNPLVSSWDSVDVLGGETLLVDGDFLLQSGSTLSMNLFDSNVHDQLIVGGDFTAAGTLEVILDAGAPALQDGDLFHLLDLAGTKSGAFDAYHLPSLGNGLIWNVTDLLSTGELSVVTDVDLDDDGLVTFSDFLVIQRTDPSLIAQWQALLGSRVVAGTNLVAAALAVPEPSALVILLTSTTLLLPFRRGTR